MKTLIGVTERHEFYNRVLSRKEFVLEMTNAIPSQSYRFIIESDYISGGMEKTRYFESLKRNNTTIELEIHNFYVFNGKSHVCFCRISDFEWIENKLHVEFEDKLRERMKSEIDVSEWNFEEV